MGKFSWTIIGLIIYFLGGWIAKDIAFSIIEITDETTLADLKLYETTIYSAVTILALIILGKNENDGSLLLYLGVVFFAWLVMNNLPVSIGLFVLYNIVNIGVIIFAVWTNDEI